MRRAYPYLRELLRSRLKSILIIALLLCAVIGLFLYESMLQSPELAKLKSQMQSISRKGATPQVDRGTTYQQATADLKRFRERIAVKKDYVRILGELYEIAKTNSVGVGGITYKPETEKGEDDLLIYRISLNVTGKYASVKSFIVDLRRMKEMVIVDMVSLNNPKMTEELVDLKVSLTVFLRLEGR